jgi:hypothetical protein
MSLPLGFPFIIPLWSRVKTKTLVFILCEKLKEIKIDAIFAKFHKISFCEIFATSFRF